MLLPHEIIVYIQSSFHIGADSDEKYIVLLDQLEVSFVIHFVVDICVGPSIYVGETSFTEVDFICNLF